MMSTVTSPASAKAVIFDLGDVLFRWSPETKTQISVKLLHQMLKSPTWADFERGDLSQSECYDLTAQQFSIPPSVVHDAFSQARDSLRADDNIVAFIQRLKQISGSGLRFYAMSNISKEDFDFLSPQLADLDLFNQVFISAKAGTRKPELEFFNYVLKSIDLEAGRVIFVDDRSENVQAARSLGIRSIQFTDSETVIGLLESQLFGLEVKRGRGHLDQHARKFDSQTDTGIVVPENFAQLMILEATQDSNLVELEWGEKSSWNFFRGTPVLIKSGYFPDDLDTTTLALMVLRLEKSRADSILDQIATYANADGTFLTYFDRKKPRVDIVVSANILACFYSYGRGQEHPQTLNMIKDALEKDDYLQKTRYYGSADCCLYFFARLMCSSISPELRDTLGPLLRKRTKERAGLCGDALDLAMRIITCTMLGINCSEDCQRLKQLQREDGSWDGGLIYKYGSTGVGISNRGLTTAMAVKAIIAALVHAG